MNNLGKNAMSVEIRTRIGEESGPDIRDRIGVLYLQKSGAVRNPCENPKADYSNLDLLESELFPADGELAAEKLNAYMESLSIPDGGMLKLDREYGRKYSYRQVSEGNPCLIERRWDLVDIYGQRIFPKKELTRIIATVDLPINWWPEEERQKAEPISELFDSVIKEVYEGAAQENEAA